VQYIKKQVGLICTVDGPIITGHLTELALIKRRDRSYLSTCADPESTPSQGLSTRTCWELLRSKDSYSFTGTSAV
jgi:hypothetical protein